MIHMTLNSQLEFQNLKACPRLSDVLQSEAPITEENASTCTCCSWEPSVAKLTSRGWQMRPRDPCAKSTSCPKRNEQLAKTWSCLTFERNWTKGATEELGFPVSPPQSPFEFHRKGEQFSRRHRKSPKFAVLNPKTPSLKPRCRGPPKHLQGPFPVLTDLATLKIGIKSWCL